MGLHGNPSSRKADWQPNINIQVNVDGTSSVKVWKLQAGIFEDRRSESVSGKLRATETPRPSVVERCEMLFVAQTSDCSQYHGTVLLRHVDGVHRLCGISN